MVPLCCCAFVVRQNVAPPTPSERDDFCCNLKSKIMYSNILVLLAHETNHVFFHEFLKVFRGDFIESKNNLTQKIRVNEWQKDLNNEFI